MRSWSRRDLFRSAGYAGTALTLGLLADQIRHGSGVDCSPLPGVSAQPSLEYDVGMLAIPVTKDGKIDDHEYDDCLKSSFEVLAPNAGATSKVSVYSKYDSDTTYFGFDFVDSATSGASFAATFDLKESNLTSQGTPDVYNLWIDITPPGSIPSYEVESKVGTAFASAFKKGADYDWQVYFGPSANSPYSHNQLEIQVKNLILQRYSNEILFVFVYSDPNGVVRFPHTYPCSGQDCTGRGIMKFVNYTLPEIPSPLILTSGVLAFPLLLAKWRQRRINLKIE